jgi:hypothetical protein
MKNIFFAFSGSLFFSSVFCLSAFAYPFKQNPNSFAVYASNLNWGRGERRYFYNLDKCTSIIENNYYLCGAGYVDVSNPLGVQVCSITSISYYYQRVSYDVASCRYK